MIRLLLACFGVAALQLGAPRALDAAELARPSGQTQSVAPRLETQAKGAVTRGGFRTESNEVALSTPGAPARRPHPPRASAYVTSPTEAPRRSASAPLPRVLPDARAPPA